jgi:hypothetical protein
MRLSDEEGVLFFKLLHALQFFVGQELGVGPKSRSVEQFARHSGQEKLPARNAVYEHPELIDAFVAKNPQKFSAEELDLVRSWKGFVAGDFFIERYLRKYSIWIGEGSPSKVYAVLGLTQPIDEVIPAAYLPYRVRGVLLPFKGKIVYDGLLQPYNIFFGSGIKASLREEYMAAKQNRRIIESLEAVTKGPRQKSTKPERDWRAEVDDLVRQADQIKGSSAAPAQSVAFALLKASARLAQVATHSPDDTDELRDAMRKVERALRKLNTTVDLMDR